MTRYIGVTVGPIYQTIAAARSTGELWGSSYIFSYLMKKMIFNMSEKILGSDYLIPFIPDDKNDPPLGGYNKAGLFPDRFILKVDDNLVDPLEMIREIRKNTLEELACEITQKLNKDHKSIINYINQYFRIYAVLYTADTDCEIVKEVNKRLDALELYARAVPSEKENYLAQLLQNKNIKNSFLYNDAFGPDPKEPLPLLHHIAAGGSGADIAAIEIEAQNQVKQELRELLTNQAKNKMPYTELLSLLDKPECEMQQLEDWLENNKDSGDRSLMTEIGQTIFSRQINFFTILKSQAYKNKAFKYVAVVKADGDGVGTYISSFTASNAEQIRNFSERLFRFGQSALDKIEQYGGRSIYIGGDDLLFIAPVLSLKKETEKEKRVPTIFDLLDELASCFREHLDTSSNDGVRMSLSFGVAMTYYGYPLYESLKQADSCLCKAKDNRVFLDGKEVKKNALVVSLIKHSGSSSDLIFNQASPGYKRFKEILPIAFPDGATQQEKFLKGLIHKIRTDQAIWDEILMLKDGSLETRMENYFNNNFDEKIHQQPPIKKYLKAVKELICEINKELNGQKEPDLSNEGEETDSGEKTVMVINQTVACLQMIKFFQEEGDD